MSKKLGVGFQFTPKACFVCGSFNHLIKDCDFHDKKMVQKPVLNNVKKGTGQREVRPVWNNAMRTNHQNFSNSRRNFAPTAVLTKSGLVPISTARQSSSRAAAPVSTARPIKTVAPKPFVNVVKSKPNAFQKVISVVGEQGINVVKSKACWVWRPKIKVLDHVSKNNGSYICKQFDYVDPTGLEFKVLVIYHTTNGHQFTMSNRQERIGYSRANDNWISKIDCLLSSEVGDEAVHKELGDRMERAATTASSFEAEQDSDAQTRFEAASKSPMIHLSQEVTHLEVGRTFDQERKEADDIDWSKIVEQAQKRQSEPKELSEEDLTEILEIVPVEETKDLLKKYDINGSSVITPMVPPNMLGPDLNGKAINETQYRANPKESQLIAVKRTFCTLSLGLQYLKRSGFDLKGYSDSNYAGCNMDRKSTSAEAEDVAAAGCCANILWIKSQLTDYDIIYEKIKNHTLKRDIEFHFIPTQYQLADIFIKLLDKPSFKRLIDELGMLNIDSKPEASVLTEEN
ncbi:hypothetical protein Tco_0678510 [Tanacetum coccineum]|uniref:Uncharacterized protein n=1 Tax=Tanacetum coccineum TaxID=301880 RepID=A0ABQ4XGL4_9ASTR